MRCLKMILTLGMLSIVLGAIPLQIEPTSAAASRGSAVQCGQWSIVPSLNPGNPSFLNGVAHVPGRSQVWAVGEYANAKANYQSLIEQWNGTSWHIIPSANVRSEWTFLFGVAAVTPANAWAVGASSSQTVIEHWDGKRWQLVNSPNPGFGGVLYSVTVVAANDIWAVGTYRDTGDVERSLTEHWNGLSWSLVTSPNVGAEENNLYSVTAVAANNIWAVGSYRTSNNTGRTLIEQWNGTSWHVVKPIDLGSSYNALQGVANVPGTDRVWAVGDYLNLGFHNNVTLVEQWNGTSWHIFKSPNFTASNNVLQGVAASSMGDIWAVGFHFNPNNGHFAKTLIEHWDGTSWHIVASPTVGSGDNFLYGVTADSSGDVWAVGNTGNGQTLIEHYCE